MRSLRKILLEILFFGFLVISTSCENSTVKMVKLPGDNFEISKTEVTQKLYESVMGENPSKFKGENNPVENVSWYDAIYFCNKLSELHNLEPVYFVEPDYLGIEEYDDVDWSKFFDVSDTEVNNTDVSEWGYTPHRREKIDFISYNSDANGYRLPTMGELRYAASGTYSDKDGQIAWRDYNSNRKTHPVALTKPNEYGLYDINGNVREWCWEDFTRGDYRSSYGGSWYDSSYPDSFNSYAAAQFDHTGFRLARTVSE